MHTLITFATQWGSKHGGVNSFNADLLSAFGVAYNMEARIICIVATASPEEIATALKDRVELIPLPYSPQNKVFDETHAHAGINQLKDAKISFEADQTVWLGHDRITGEAAIAAARIAGGRSAVIHHMSYDQYESYAEDSHSAQVKTQKQKEIFLKADLILAVGPLLRDAASDLVGDAKPVGMLIPGLAEIVPQSAPKTFVAFLSGRLSDDAARIKQGHLGIAAFASAHASARDNGFPDALRNQPKLLLRGVDFEDQLSRATLDAPHNPEAELKRFAEAYASAVINLHALPYTFDRRQLYSELKSSSVALMPSWHEGFGLVAWEAIAAVVPLIISKNSGVYRLLEDEYPGAGTGCVYPIDVRGATDPPYFRQEDLEAVTAALNEIANNPNLARNKAAQLKNLLKDRTWAACAGELVSAVGWDIKKGSIQDIIIPSPAQVSDNIVPAIPVTERAPLQMPVKRWRAGKGLADSLLLRAEEAVLPFDPARQPEIDVLNNWLDDESLKHTVRLITGAGGQGKTRLSLEVCQQRLASGWRAGFLNSELEEGGMPNVWQTLRDYQQPLLIVIDYAETRQPAFLKLLKAALQNPAEHSVRMLLLARDGGEWWDNLPGKDSFCESFLSGRATTGPFRLPPMYAAEHDRQKAFDKALHTFADALETKAPNISPDLAGDHFERPLYIQMAALLTLYGETPTTAQGLTDALLRHERRYWSGLLAHFKWTEPERYAEQLLALSTLAGGFATPKDAERHRESAESLRSLKPAEFTSLFRELATLYPGTQGLQALRPDLLGEALVAQTLLHPGGETLLDAVLANSASAQVRRNALTVLARLSTQRPDVHETLVEGFVRHFGHCCQEIVAVSTETTSRLPELAGLAFARLSLSNKSQVVGLLKTRLMEESVQLAGLTCLITEYSVEKLGGRSRNRPNDLNLMAEHAAALANHGIALGRIGHYSEACDVDLCALEIFRRLTRKNPARFEPDYATSLNNYANDLSDAGRNHDALEYSQQALEIRRRLAQANPDRFEPDYAVSLNNYANRLSEVGRSEEALEHSWQSLEIRRRLMQKSPRRFADVLFSTTCQTEFIAWLCYKDKQEEQPDLDQILTSVPSHERPLMLLFSAFVEACAAKDQAVRSNAFRQVLSHWNELSVASKNRGEPYWLCAAAWCAKYEPAALAESDWLDRWRQFAKQRKGRMPAWMLETARRLDFQFPE